MLKKWQVRRYYAGFKHVFNWCVKDTWSGIIDSVYPDRTSCSIRRDYLNELQHGKGGKLDES